MQILRANMKNKIKKSRNLVKEFGRFFPERQNGKIFDSGEQAVKTMVPSYFQDIWDVFLSFSRMDY